jgi:Amt family ammonium transporter
MLGKRVGVGKENMAPHNLTFTGVGTGMLLLGWFGFNAGSNLESNGLTALVIVNTILGATAATLAWSFCEWLTRGHASFLGAASGMVAGLVAITPACGWVGPMSAIVIGLAAGAVCLWAVVWLKAKLGYDDALDVFGVHGIGGILGALLTGIFVNPNWAGGWQGMGVTDYLATDTSTKLAEYSLGFQFNAQLTGVIVAVVLSAVVSAIALVICKFTVGLRVDEPSEREGLDLSSHGERAYS